MNPTETRPQRPILIGYDGSPHAREAVEEAARLFAGSPAVVATVWLSFEASAPAALLALPNRMVQDAAGDLDASQRDEAERLAAEGADLARAGGLAAEPRAAAADGPYFSALVELADALDAGALVVGSRGRSALAATVSGACRRACCTTPAGPSSSSERTTDGSGRDVLEDLEVIPRARGARAARRPWPRRASPGPGSGAACRTRGRAPTRRASSTSPRSRGHRRAPRRRPAAPRPRRRCGRRTSPSPAPRARARRRGRGGSAPRRGRAGPGRSRTAPPPRPRRPPRSAAAARPRSGCR
jgi:nucleotide-binding universal stress UspA family protein